MSESRFKGSFPEFGPLTVSTPRTAAKVFAKKRVQQENVGGKWGGEEVDQSFLVTQLSQLKKKKVRQRVSSGEGSRTEKGGGGE